MSTAYNSNQSIKPVNGIHSYKRTNPWYKKMSDTIKNTSFGRFIKKEAFIRRGVAQLEKARRSDYWENADVFKIVYAAALTIAFGALSITALILDNKEYTQNNKPVETTTYNPNESTPNTVAATPLFKHRPKDNNYVYEANNFDESAVSSSVADTASNSNSYSLKIGDTIDIPDVWNIPYTDSTTHPECSSSVSGKTVEITHVASVNGGEIDSIDDPNSSNNYYHLSIKDTVSCSIVDLGWTSIENVENILKKQYSIANSNAIKSNCSGRLSKPSLKRNKHLRSR